MLKAEFISVEGGKDMIVSFAIAPDAHKSLTLLRTPKYEALLPVEERGVTVGFGASVYERELLQRAKWTATFIEIVTNLDRYTVELSSVDPREIMNARSMLRKMIKGTGAIVNE
jgi:hypothetical protein